MSKKHLLGYTTTALLALIIGASSASGDTPEPVVQTKTIPGPTVTKTVTKTEVPKVCLDALDAGEKVSHIGSDALMNAGAALETVPDLINAMATMDTYAMDKINNKVEKLVDKMDPDALQSAVADYNVKSTACRSK